jgi:putative transcriptional regulator
LTYTGKLLIAKPSLEHPLFIESTVLVCRDSANGTIGVILNKPCADYTVADACDLADAGYLLTQPLFRGGPVNMRAVTLLHSNEWYSSNTIQVTDELAMSSDPLMLEKIATGNTPRNWKLFVGVCMWSRSQLDAELNGTAAYSPNGSWIIADPDMQHVFMDDTENQWKQSMELCASQLVNQYF